MHARSPPRLDRFRNDSFAEAFTAAFTPIRVVVCSRVSIAED